MKNGATDLDKTIIYIITQMLTRQTKYILYLITLYVLEVKSNSKKRAEQYLNCSQYENYVLVGTTWQLTDSSTKRNEDKRGLINDLRKTNTALDWHKQY